MNSGQVGTDEQDELYGRFLAFCVETGHVSSEARMRVFNALKSSALPLDVIVTELGIISDTVLEDCLSCFCGVPPAVLEGPNGRLEPACEFDFAYATTAGLLPIAIDDNLVRIAAANPLDLNARAICEFYFDRTVVFEPCARKRLMEQLESMAQSGGAIESLQELPGEAGSMPEQDLSRLRDLALETPVVNLVSRVVQAALESRATDIHLEPGSENVRVRLRLDGVLQPFENFPVDLHAGVVSRIKILAGMNIAERRLPQDGRMRLSIRGTEVDFRVSSIPSIHGETLVLRLLRQGVGSMELSSLGFAPEAATSLLAAAHDPHGLFIVTGPTGSGKTTTLYSIIEAINKPGIKIFTIEDPVEYRIEGVTQLQVDASINLDFSRALRSILRQDPDVILVGEIRDRETAQIAVQAALTGHLVLTTLHTNDSVGAVSRLKDMGVDPFLLTSTVRIILAQRLLRKLCGHHPGHAKPDCPHCKGTGFSGRTVTYEILEMTPAIKRLVDEGGSDDQLRAQARTDGFRSLELHARQLVEDGVTSATEVARVVSDRRIE